MEPSSDDDGNPSDDEDHAQGGVRRRNANINPYFVPHNEIGTTAIASTHAQASETLDLGFFHKPKGSTIERTGEIVRSLMMDETRINRPDDGERRRDLLRLSSLYGAGVRRIRSLKGKKRRGPKGEKDYLCDESDLESAHLKMNTDSFFVDPSSVNALELSTTATVITIFQLIPLLELQLRLKLTQRETAAIARDMGCIEGRGNNTIINFTKLLVGLKRYADVLREERIQQRRDKQEEVEAARLARTRAMSPDRALPGGPVDSDSLNSALSKLSDTAQYFQNNNVVFFSKLCDTNNSVLCAAMDASVARDFIKQNLGLRLTMNEVVALIKHTDKLGCDKLSMSYFLKQLKILGLGKLCDLSPNGARSPIQLAPTAHQHNYELNTGKATYDIQKEQLAIMQAVKDQKKLLLLKQQQQQKLLQVQQQQYQVNKSKQVSRQNSGLASTQTVTSSSAVTTTTTTTASNPGVKGKTNNSKQTLAVTAPPVLSRQDSSSSSKCHDINKSRASSVSSADDDDDDGDNDAKNNSGRRGSSVNHRKGSTAPAKPASFATSSSLIREYKAKMKVKYESSNIHNSNHNHGANSKKSIRLDNNGTESNDAITMGNIASRNKGALASAVSPTRSLKSCSSSTSSPSILSPTQYDPHNRYNHLQFKSKGRGKYEENDDNNNEGVDYESGSDCSSSAGGRGNKKGGGGRGGARPVMNMKSFGSADAESPVPVSHSLMNTKLALPTAVAPPHSRIVRGGSMNILRAQSPVALTRSLAPADNASLQTIDKNLSHQLQHSASFSSASAPHHLSNVQSVYSNFNSGHNGGGLRAAHVAASRGSSVGHGSASSSVQGGYGSDAGSDGEGGVLGSPHAASAVKDHLHRGIVHLPLDAKMHQLRYDYRWPLLATLLASFKTRKIQLKTFIPMLRKHMRCVQQPSHAHSGSGSTGAADKHSESSWAAGTGGGGNYEQFLITRQKLIDCFQQYMQHDLAVSKLNAFVSCLDPRKRGGLYSFELAAMLQCFTMAMTYHEEHKLGLVTGPEIVQQLLTTAATEYEECFIASNILNSNVDKSLPQLVIETVLGSLCTSAEAEQELNTQLATFFGKYALMRQKFSQGANSGTTVFLDSKNIDVNKVIEYTNQSTRLSEFILGQYRQALYAMTLRNVQSA